MPKSTQNLVAKRDNRVAKLELVDNHDRCSKIVKTTEEVENIFDDIQSIHAVLLDLVSSSSLAALNATMNEVGDRKINAINCARQHLQARSAEDVTHSNDITPAETVITASKGSSLSSSGRRRLEEQRMEKLRQLKEVERKANAELQAKHAALKMEQELVRIAQSEAVQKAKDELAVVDEALQVESSRSSHSLRSKSHKSLRIPQQSPKNSVRNWLGSTSNLFHDQTILETVPEIVDTSSDNPPIILPLETSSAPVVDVPVNTTNPFESCVTIAGENHIPSSKFDRSGLSRIQLSTFSGNPLEWPEWSGMFTATIGTSSMSNQEKMIRLKNLFSGRAHATIANLSFDGNMFPQAWSLLERRFGKPHVIVSAQLEKITTYPIVKMHNSESIMQYSLVVSSLVNVLAEYKYHHDLYSSSNLQLVLSKLPPNLKDKWSEYVITNGIAQPSLSSLTPMITWSRVV